MTIPASREDHTPLDVHLADIDWVLELEDTFTNSHVLEGPLSQRAIIRAREEAVNIVLNSLEVINLIGVTQEWDLRRSLLARLHSVDVPAADKTIAVAREHQLRHLIAEEAECCDIILDQELLLVLRCVQGVIWAEILQLTIRLLEVIQIVFCRLSAHYVVDSLSSTLMLNHYRNKKRSKSVSNSYCLLIASPSFK